MNLRLQGEVVSGDPVKQLSTGFVAQWTAATATSQNIGIFAGCQYLSSSQNRTLRSPYWVGSDVASTQTVTGYVIPVNLAVPLLFLAQTDATGCAFADIGLNVDIALGTGNTNSGVSGAYIDMSTKATTATL
ncbi:MAG: hypothetical protein EBX57_08115, partial [Betaproteobacteria bacterium]|nr:hypothetical protein [Betaproteobacteria bacterium]